MNNLVALLQRTPDLTSTLRGRRIPPMRLPSHSILPWVVSISIYPFCVCHFCIGSETFTPTESARREYNFDIDWKFLKEEKAKLEGAAAPEFDDSGWETVSTPHSFNDVDSFRTLISHGGGDRGTWKGTVWYRKHFRLPAGSDGR